MTENLKENKAENLDDMQTSSFLDCIWLLDSCIQKNLIQQDPEDPNRILVYRNAGIPAEDNPEGWYSENVFTAAEELIDNPEGQAYLKEQLSESGETKYA